MSALETKAGLEKRENLGEVAFPLVRLDKRRKFLLTKP
jgi:hypothetical protein